MNKLSKQETREELIDSFIVSTVDMRDPAIQAAWAPALDAITDELCILDETPGDDDGDPYSERPGDILNDSSVMHACAVLFDGSGQSICTLTKRRLINQPRSLSAAQVTILDIRDIEYLGWGKTLEKPGNLAELVIGLPRQKFKMQGSADDLGILASFIDDPEITASQMPDPVGGGSGHNVLPASQLKTIYERYNDINNKFVLRGLEDTFLNRLSEVLDLGEKVYCLIAFRSERPGAMLKGLATGKAAVPLATLLAVTSHRVVFLIEGGFMSQAFDKMRGNEDHLINHGEAPYASLDHIDGRKTVLDFGSKRELYLKRPDGSFIKVMGLTTDQSMLAQHKIEQAMGRRSSTRRDSRLIRPLEWYAPIQGQLD